jgi:capsular polysaccharide biosynthesis protein
MSNWPEFRKVLSKKLASRGYSFQFVNPEHMTAEEQVFVSSRATLYVSVHGANFANQVWMNPCATSLEIVSKFNKFKHYERLANDYNTFYLRYVAQHWIGNDIESLLLFV